MADNTTLPGTGDVVEDLQIANLSKRQVVTIGPRDLQQQDSIGSLTETPPTNDTNSSGLNGRLTRIAQRITSMIALFPATLGQKAKAAAFPVTLASDEDLLAKLDTLHADLGSLGAAGASGYSAKVTLTRTADTNAYIANDVVGSATGSTAALQFASMGPSGAVIRLNGASLEIDAAALLSGESSYTLHLYNITPPSALGDNAAFDLPSGDRASYLGSVFLGQPADLGSTLYISIDGDVLQKQVKLAGTALWGYLVTNGGYTPTSARVHAVTLHSEAL